METVDGRYVIEGLHGRYNSDQHIDTIFIPYIYDEEEDDYIEGEPETRLVTNHDLGWHAKEMDGKNHNYLYIRTKH